MASPFDPSAYGRSISDIYDETVEHLPTEATVELLHLLADGGPVLEFGIGTGRLALPLTARGVTVAGIDGSPDMVAVLRAKPGGEHLQVAVGDFATTRVDGLFSLVALTTNTIFALPSQDAQVACFRNAAAHLRPGGRFVVEAWCPTPRPSTAAPRCGCWPSAMTWWSRRRPGSRPPSSSWPPRRCG